MRLDRSSLRRLIREQLVLLIPGDSDGMYEIEPPDSTDAWHPSEVVPLEDAWSGGDNLVAPAGLGSEFFKDESDAGPHSVADFSGTPEPLGGECGGQNFSPLSSEEEIDLLDLFFLREADDIVDSPAPSGDGLIDNVDASQMPEREDIVVRIIGDMDEAGLTGDTGLFQQVDNVDEFEDLIRHIFQDVRIDNRQLASVAMSIAKDFLEDPEDAYKMSNFNL